MAPQRSLVALIAAVTALLLVLLMLCADSHARADAFKLASSTPTSTTSSSLLVPAPRRHHRRRRPVLGPRPVTGVRRRYPASSEKNAEEDPAPPLPAPSLSPSHPTDLLSRCRELWRDATLDHFSGWRPRRSADVDSDAGDEQSVLDNKNKGHRRRRRRRRQAPEKFRQRYFVCDDQWAGPGSPVFFYFGNEADVTLYLNATGLMWQSAPVFGAALVFAEHRGYGRSKIPSLRWLTTDQAMADYADLILELRSANSTVFEARNPAPAASLSSSTPPKLDFSSSPLRGGAAGAAVIGFGGSYGGMLAAWMRMRYPSAVDGVVAASAPIWSYGGLDPEFDAGSFAATVTDDAGPKGGASEACSENVREAWKVLFASVEDENGEPGEGGRVTPAAASAALRLCSPSGAAGGEHQSRALATREDAQLVADWASAAFDSCAMGMFPYPSSYMLNGDAELPAWPMRAICGGRLSEANLTGVAVLEALAEGISVYFNATRDAVCYDPLGGGGSSSDATDEDGSLWGWQYCSQQFMPFSKDGVRDMFWPAPWDAEAAVQACRDQFGVAPDPLYASRAWGGKRISWPPSALTNAVFSNGLLDPWHGGGVLEQLGFDDSVAVVLIPEGGHHVDLFFENEADPPSVKEAREVERRAMRRWVEEVRARKEGAGAGRNDDERGSVASV